MACQPGWTLMGTTCIPPSLPSTTLATGGSTIQTLALDTNNVYWTDSSAGTVNAVPKTGGTVLVLAQNQSKPMGLAVDDSYAYWSNNLGGAIMRAPKDGSGSPSVVIALTSPDSIAVVGANLYWVQSGDIASTPKTGGGTVSSLNLWSTAPPSGTQAVSLTGNGTYLAAIVYVAALSKYFDIIDPTIPAVVAQMNLTNAGILTGSINSSGIYYENGVNCASVAWAPLPSTSGPSGQSPTNPRTICGGGDPNLVVGNSCGVFWNGPSNTGDGVNMGSKASGAIYPVGIAAGPASALAADDGEVFVGASGAITRFSVQ
jgi:hypothetical protein